MFIRYVLRIFKRVGLLCLFLDFIIFFEKKSFIKDVKKIFKFVDNLLFLMLIKIIFCFFGNDDISLYVIFRLDFILFSDEVLYV